MSPPMDVLRLGRMGWDAGWEVQTAAHAAVVAGAADRLILVEHPPTITLGRSTRPEDLPLTDEELRARGLSVFQASRGGSVTYHGPGQVVAYPIVNLRRRGVAMRAYVEVLEEATAGVLGEFGIEAYIRPGLTGVWTHGGKIAAIGVQVSRGVTLHGLALNVEPDLAAFDLVVPCGLAGEPVTSMAREGVETDMVHVEEALVGWVQRSLAQAGCLGR
ncbi:MAG: lipoyl(octanoyl) transferase LipB [Armatimonadia bacterium]|nr:lipoyl(octanoyl) transferase LipB [Armatimonadia bacterium]